MKDRRKRDVLIPEVLSSEIDNIDTYAQWDKTHYNININPAKPYNGVSVTSKPNKVSSNQDASIILDFTLEHYTTVDGVLNQSVPIGSAMKSTTVKVASAKKMLPESAVSGTRPSGIKLVNTDGVKLTISGTPTSDDEINIDVPIDKRRCTIIPMNNTGVEVVQDPTVVDELSKNNSAWFSSRISLNIRPDSGHEFIDYNTIKITPQSMLDAIIMNANKSMISIEWDEKYGMPLTDVTVQAPAVKLSGYRVTINLPEGIERESGGALVQDVVIGQEITQVNLRSTDNDRYKWNDTVQTFTQDGITFNIDTSQTPIVTAWISGTPLRSVAIDVPAPDAYHKLTINYGTGLTDWSGYMYDTTPAFAPVVKWVKHETSTSGWVYAMPSFRFTDGDPVLNNSDNNFENDPYYASYIDTVIINPSNAKEYIVEHIEVYSSNTQKEEYDFKISSMIEDIEITLPDLKTKNPDDVVIKINVDMNHIKQSYDYNRDNGTSDANLTIYNKRDGSSGNPYNTIELHAEDGYWFGPGWNYTSSVPGEKLAYHYTSGPGSTDLIIGKTNFDISKFPDGISYFNLDAPVPIGQPPSDMYIKVTSVDVGGMSFDDCVIDGNTIKVAKSVDVSEVRIPYIMLASNVLGLNGYDSSVCPKNIIESILSRVFKTDSIDIKLLDILTDYSSDRIYSFNTELSVVSIENSTPIPINSIMKWSDPSLDEPSDVTIELIDEYYEVTVTLGKHMSYRYPEYIKDKYIILHGKGKTICHIDVEDGYSMGSYTSTVVDGISIKVNNDVNSIVISGTPSKPEKKGTINIVLPDAVKLVNLTVNLPADGSVKVKDGEENRLNQSIEAGEYIDGITLVPKDANYKMTQAWRQTITVEPANEHITMMTSDTETYISGRISENTVITVPALSLTFSPSVKQGALLIMAPLSGTPVGNDGMSIRIKAPKVLNGTYGDFTFNNSDTAVCGSTYSDRSVLYDVPPGEYTATFTYEMSFDTKFTLTGNSSVIIDDSNRGSVTETSMIYNLTGIAFGNSSTDFAIQASGTVYESINFTTTSTMMRPDFPDESDMQSAQSFINDLQAYFELDDQNIHLEVSADLPYLVYSGGVNLKSFVLIDTKTTKRIRKVTFAPYG